MCKGNCKACRHLQIPCRSSGNIIACCFECDKYGIWADSIADMYPTVMDELREAKRQGGDNDQYFGGAILGNDILVSWKTDKAQIIKAGVLYPPAFTLPCIVK